MTDREMIKESIIRAVRNGAKNEELRLIIDELLREQEPVPPKFDAFSVRCGNCGDVLDVAEPDKYCPWCGRKVKWNA